MKSVSHAEQSIGTGGLITETATEYLGTFLVSAEAMNDDNTYNSIYALYACSLLIVRISSGKYTEMVHDQLTYFNLSIGVLTHSASATLRHGQKMEISQTKAGCYNPSALATVVYMHLLPYVVGSTY